MMLVAHVLACAAVWFVVGAAMGLFIGAFIGVGSGE